MEVVYKKIDGDSRAYFATLIILGILVAIGGCAFWLTYTEGHWVTSMNNRVPWGLLIASADFGKGLSAGMLIAFIVLIEVVGIPQFRAFTRMTPFVAVLVFLSAIIFIFMDIGKIDHAMNTMLYSNPTSLLSWDGILYTGYMGSCALYLLAKWEERRRIAKFFGILSLAWAVLVLGATGLIIGFMYGRELYHAAIHAPLTIAYAIGSGLGLTMIIILATFRLTNRYISSSIVEYLAKIWGAVIIAVLFLITAEALEKAYMPAASKAVEFSFTNLNAGLWFVVVVIGLLIPLAMIIPRGGRRSLKWMTVAGLLYLAGFWVKRFLDVVPGLRYPMEYLPGYEMHSLQTMESAVVAYIPNAIEWAEFVGVFALVALLYMIGIKIWDIVPETTEGLE